MKNLRRMGILAILLVLAAVVWVYFQARLFMDTAPKTPGEEVLFDVLAGANMSQVADNLHARGLVTDSRKFIWLARMSGKAGSIKAGRFALNTGWKPEKILDILVNGKPVLYRVTIPEGLTWWQTARLLEDAGFVRYNDFRDAIMDADFLRHYGIPFSTAEGFLMPDTYLLKKPDLTASGADAPNMDEVWKNQSRSVAGRLIDNFWQKADKFWQPVPSPDAVFQPEVGQPATRRVNRPHGAELRKLITLASIVEKETALDSERPRVAGVYANRLARNMLLQADPTVIYGLGPSFKGPLSRSQLDDVNNLYNTYQRTGLPPGPISSFGMAALNAAINPEKHDYLYFVAITDGGAHNFSRTLDEHNRAVRDYRRQKSSK